MTGEEVYLAWAPDGGRWSRWVKPVLFAHVDDVGRDDEPPPEHALPPDWHHGLTARGTALLVELPGAEAVAAGAIAAEIGFQPVPLFNALPGPAGGRSFPSAAESPIETVPKALLPWNRPRGPIPICAVDVQSIVRALVASAPRLRGGGIRGRGLPPDAPPAFLVDSHRHHSRGPLVLGRFDNRSAHSVADFPSAARLREAGVQRVVLLLHARQPGWDLLPTLSHWRAGGIAVELKRTGVALAPQRWPGFFAGWLLRPLAWMHRLGLHGNGRRGFGGWSSPATG